MNSSLVTGHLSLPRTFILTVNRTIQRFDDTCAHLDSLGIKWEPFIGMDNQLCRLNPVDTFDLDRAGERIGPKHVAATLTHYLCWKVCSYLPEEAFWILEFDVRFVPDWQPQYDSAMSILPHDWDIVFLGSCCTAGRETKHIGNNLYEVKHPLCGHALQIRKKALPILLDIHQKIAMPLDIAMYYNSLTQLRVYTILPRIIEQHGTFLPI